MHGCVCCEDMSTCVHVHLQVRERERGERERIDDDVSFAFEETCKFLRSLDLGDNAMMQWKANF